MKNEIGDLIEETIEDNSTKQDGKVQLECTISELVDIILKRVASKLGVAQAKLMQDLKVAREERDAAYKKISRLTLLLQQVQESTSNDEAND